MTETMPSMINKINEQTEAIAKIDTQNSLSLLLKGLAFSLQEKSTFSETRLGGRSVDASEAAILNRVYSILKVTGNASFDIMAQVRIRKEEVRGRTRSGFRRFDKNFGRNF